MPKVFRINTINSDGSEAEEVLREYVVKGDDGEPLMEDGKPSVVITYRPISTEEYREAERRNTKRKPATRGEPAREVTDWNTLQDDLVDYAIRGWRGVVGADGKPLDCIRVAKVALDGAIKNEIFALAMKGEAVDSAESFRATA